MHQRVPQTGFSAFQKMNENDSISGSVAKAMKELPDETRALYKQFAPDTIDAGDQLECDYAYKAVWKTPRRSTLFR